VDPIDNSDDREDRASRKFDRDQVDKWCDHQQEWDTSTGDRRKEGSKSQSDKDELKRHRCRDLGW
jgi:hypothetical protein